MEILKNIRLFIGLIAFVSMQFTVQSQDNLKQAFDDGEYFVSLEDYQEALYNYQRILKRGISNSNIQYRIGMCYANIPGEKATSIPYLEEAIKSITLTYTEGSYKETQAPAEAFYYLAFAYQVNNEFDQAINNYRKYIALLPKTDVLSLRYTQQQIKACQNAKKEIEKPKPYIIEKLSNRFNNSSDNLYPIISGNDSVFVFSSKLKFYDAIFATQKNKGTWDFPKNINQQILSDGKFVPSSLSHDGKTLFMSVNDNFKSTIITSKYNDSIKMWMPFEKNKELNSKFWVSGASISKEGNTIFFSSNQTGSIGGMDIFMIEKKDNKWSKPISLPGKVNTEFNEESPFITADGKKLFFVSQGHDSNLGGYDIFYSTKEGGSWSTPVNIGYPISTSDDNKFFCPTGDGNGGYYSRMSDEVKDKYDIYFMKFE